MTRQSIPAYCFEFRGGLSGRGEVMRTCSLIDGGTTRLMRYWLDDFPLAAGLGRRMPSPVADLIDVASAIYIADRLALREVVNDPRIPQDRWHRRIHIVVPVRDPQRWIQSEVIACVEDLLAFLTDDEWTIEFVHRSDDPRRSEIQIPLLSLHPDMPAIILQSGGLDSFAGLIELLSQNDSSVVMPVTVVTNHRVRRTLLDIIDAIRQDRRPAEPELIPTVLRVGLSGVGRSKDDQEPSQRARGLLYLAAGVGSMAMANAERLNVCENGVGAISLAMTPDHWGSRATKAMHPRTLVLFAELASLVLEKPVSIVNLGFFDTKGDLVRRYVQEPFVEAARHTISCDQMTYLRRGEACGKCTSCIMRRVALISAGMDASVDGVVLRYLTDWLDPESRWDGENAVHIVAMRHQVERLRLAVEGERRFAGLDQAFPALFDVVALASVLGHSEEELECRIFRLYQSYVNEFDAFVAKIDRPGWGRQADVTALIQSARVVATG